MKRYMSNVIKRVFNPKKLYLETYVVEEPEDYTDEIEKSLWEIKESFDLPTEEVQKSITGYRNRNTRE